MRILEVDGMTALCEPFGNGASGEQRRVSLALLGVEGLAAGSLVLVHIDTALRVLDEREAKLVADAHRGLAAANQGLPIEEYFVDLVGREPELPEHLRVAKVERKA